MKLASRIVIAMLALTAVAACGIVTTLTVRRGMEVGRPDAVRRGVEIEAPPGFLDDRNNLALDFQSPGRARLVSHEDFGTCDGDEDLVRAVIDDELADADPEEREIWRDELKQHSPETIREILSLRRHLAPLNSSGAVSDVQHSSADVAPPRLLKEAVPAIPLEASADALNLLESAVDAIRSGEQVILNNIANARTVGFKRSRALFGDLTPRQLTLPGQIDQRGRPTTTGVALGTGIRLTATQADLSQGRLRHTRQPLDLAIQGNGYFQINEGTHFSYTRKGSFGVNCNGEIVLTSADRSRPLEPAITIPQDTAKIEISSDGIVSVLQTGQSQMNQIGQIQLARFTNAQALVSVGEDRLEQTSGSGNPFISSPGQDGLGELRQGYLEESNVEMADEMAELRRLREHLRALLQLQAESSRVP